MAYYSAVKRNEVPIYATTKINLENIILSERNCHKRPHILYDSIYMRSPEEANP